MERCSQVAWTVVLGSYMEKEKDACGPFPFFFPFLSFATIFHLRNVASLSTVPPRLDATVPPRVQEGIVLQPASRQD